MRCVLIGGPLDGSQKEIQNSPPPVVWVNRDDLRFFKASHPDRILYRSVGHSMETDRARAYLYAENTHAFCCDTLHKVTKKHPSCSICGQTLHTSTSTTR